MRVSAVLPLFLCVFPLFLELTTYFTLLTDITEYVTRSARREKGVDRVHMHCQLCHQSSVTRDEFIGHTIGGISRKMRVTSHFPSSRLVREDLAGSLFYAIRPEG